MTRHAGRVIGIRAVAPAAIALAASGVLAPPAAADAAKPGQSMTHMKTEPGFAAGLEGLGVVLYVQGGATAAVMGDSLAAPNGQVVLHIPVTGSTPMFFSTASNQQVQLRNPTIDLKSGVISAVIPQAGDQPTSALTITNAKELAPKLTTDRKTGVRTTTYSGAKLALAPGVSAARTSILGLPAGSLSEGASFGTADITVNSTARRA